MLVTIIFPIIFPPAGRACRKTKTGSCLCAGSEAGGGNHHGVQNISLSSSTRPRALEASCKCPHALSHGSNPTKYSRLTIPVPLFPRAILVVGFVSISATDLNESGRVELEPLRASAEPISSLPVGSNRSKARLEFYRSRALVAKARSSSARYNTKAQEPTHARTRPTPPTSRSPHPTSRYSAGGGPYGGRRPDGAAASTSAGVRADPSFSKWSVPPFASLSISLPLCSNAGRLIRFRCALFSSSCATFVLGIAFRGSFSRGIGATRNGILPCWPPFTCGKNTAFGRAASRAFSLFKFSCAFTLHSSLGLNLCLCDDARFNSTETSILRAFATSPLVACFGFQCLAISSLACVLFFFFGFMQALAI
jgi:hypothetical protein